MPLRRLQTCRSREGQPLKQIKFHEIVAGRTIKAFDCETGCRFTILFDDDTFVSVEVCGVDAPWLANDEIDLNDLGNIRHADTLIKFGIIDKDEYERAEQEQMEKDRLRNLAYKRQKYLQLRKDLGYE